MFERNVLRGEVYVTDLSAHGGRLAKVRPALVVQNDRGNFASPETIVLGIRSAGPDKYLPIRVPVRRGVGGLMQDSFIDAGQILTLRKESLGTRVGKMPPEIMARVDQALRISLGLS